MIEQSYDIVLENARLGDAPDLVDIGISDGRFAAIGRLSSVRAGSRFACHGRAVLPGFVDSHIHLDKACLLGRCGHQPGGLSAAIRAVSELKKDFTVDDVYARGARVLEKAIVKGTTHMRTHVEVDPRVGLRSFDAIKALKRDYAWAIGLQVCVFPQEGLTNDPGTEELLEQALQNGADLIGGCPYTDTDPNRHIERIFSLAQEYKVDIDFHLDFDLDPSWRHLDEVCRRTRLNRYEGRVAIGHVSKLSALPPASLSETARLLADSGVALTVLPATDLYLMGREFTHNVPRGLAPAHQLIGQNVTCSVATNNVLNPFTPFGDCSLLRMANLYANAAQVEPTAFNTCMGMVTDLPAKLMNLPDYGIAVGNPADLVVLDAQYTEDAIAEIAEPLMVFKSGRQTVRRDPPVLLR